MDISKLRFYSIGTVAENKLPGSNTIEVVALEVTSFVDGELTSNVDMSKTSATDANGESYQCEVETTVTLPATWLAIGQSNRLTAPDVERGATVVLYRLGNDDTIWWTTLQNDMHLRRLETVIFGIKATKKLDEEPNANNMYWIEWSSHKKLIHLHTSKADGEFCTYDFQIDTKNGKVAWQDDVGNEFCFDSKERRIEMLNADGSHIDMNKTKIRIFAKDQIDIESKVINLTAGETINEKSKTHNVESTKINIKASTVASVATWSHKGTMASTGIIKSDEDVKAGDISLTKHRHTGVRGGSDTSAGPVA